MVSTTREVKSSKSPTVILEVSYKDLRWKYTFLRYDIVWAGLAEYKGELYKAITEDLTDYDAMSDSCPSCSIDADPCKPPYCTCESYTDTVTKLTPLTFWERLTWRYNTARLFRK